MVKQNIVFVENTPGSLQKVTKRSLQRIRSTSTGSAVSMHRSSQTSVWYVMIRKKQIRSWQKTDI